jgi:VanZ family protein
LAKAGRNSFFGTFLWYWLPVLVYVTIIFVLSAQPNLQSPFTFQNGDKLAHILEYGGLGFLLARAFRGARPDTAPLIHSLTALIIGMAIGVSDELFQAHVPGRDSNPLDFLADTIGLALAQLAFLVFHE